ncbi:MAG: FMN-binding protein [Bacteroidales bacterium]|nr:FMN-binding protein [Bacteroidales bacterium]
MKYLIIAVVSYFGLFITNNVGDLSPRIQKSIEKEIKKIWKDEDVIKTPMKIDESTAQELQIEADKNFVLKSGNKTLAYLFVRRTKGCVIGGCSEDGVQSFQEPVIGERYEHFDYMLILNKDLSVKKVKILVYDGEYGYEVGSKLWLKQFIGYSGGELNYGKDIQALSGATVSAQSITEDIQQMHEIALELRKKGII